MTPVRWEQLESLFAKAVELGPDDRQKLLERECADDRELEVQLLGLLRCDEQQAESLRKTVRHAWGELLLDLGAPES